MRYIYSLIAVGILPFALLKLLVRSLKDRQYLTGWLQRAGISVSEGNGKPIWIHAVSVGEVRAVSPLVKRLLQRFPNKQLHFSTTTPTGARMVRQQFGVRVNHSYFPYDIPVIVTRFLRRLDPSLIIIVETEIWPNLYHACKVEGVPLCLINARLSSRSLKRYQLVRPLIKQALNNTAFISAKSDQDRQRFMQLGVNANKIKITGNMKFDANGNARADGITDSLKVSVKTFNSVWLAGSTHVGEEQLVLDAHAAIRSEQSGVLLILVPRHPERAEEVLKLCDDKGFQAVLTSQLRQKSASFNVLICNQLGLLVSLYSLADIAYVGGSLVEHGGHNPLEPAMLGLPVITGPHTWNFNDVYSLMFSKRAALAVTDVTELSTAVLQLMQDESLRKEMAQAASEIIEKNKGVTDKLIDMLGQYIS